MTIYQLSEEFLTLKEMLGDDSIDPEIIQTTLDGIEGEIEYKADGYGMVRTELKAFVESIKAEEQRLANRRRAIENNIKRLENTLKDAMEKTGKTKFKTALFSFGIQNNPVSVVIDDPTAIPENFLIPQEPKVDKAAIKDLLKETEVNWAHLESSKGIRIR